MNIELGKNIALRANEIVLGDGLDFVVVQNNQGQ